MITIHLRRYRAKIRIIGDKVVEENQTPLSNYTETKDTNNVSDIPSLRQKFIEEVGRKIYNQNRQAEIKAVQKRASVIEKVIIYNVT